MPNGAGGGGGGGTIVGASNSFTGPSQSIELVGNHFFAYTGQIVASATLNTVLSFTTGNYTCVGRMSLSPYMVPSTLTDQLQAGAQISLNGSIVVFMTSGSSQEDARSSDESPIIIPPYTVVKVEVDAPSDQAAYFGSFIMTGRIYRG